MKDLTDGSKFLYETLLKAKIIDDRPIKWLRIEAKVGEVPTVEVEYVLTDMSKDIESK